MTTEKPKKVTIITGWTKSGHPNAMLSVSGHVTPDELIKIVKDSKVDIDLNAHISIVQEYEYTPIKWYGIISSGLQHPRHTT